MDKVQGWIQTFTGVLVLFVMLLIFFFQSCANQREVNIRFNEVNKRLDVMGADIKSLNQNLINHLEHHNKKED
jgi:hypothetical protein